jgi:acetylornithine deacetylase
MIERIKSSGIIPDRVIVGEATGMDIFDVHRGVKDRETSIETHLISKAGHSAQLDESTSAIQIATKFFSALNNKIEKINRECDERNVSCNIGTIMGGTAINVIPKNCTIGWDCRYSLPEELKAVDEFFNEWCQSQPAIISNNIKCDIPPLIRKDENLTAKMCERILCSQKRTDMYKGGTEAGIYQKTLGADVVVCGPGFPEQAHADDEYISIDQLNKCIDFLMAF